MSKVFNMVGGGGGATASIFVNGFSETDSVKATHKIPGQVVNPKWKSLPDDYTQLEYIESTGTQYINSGISPNKPLRTITEASFSDSSNGWQIIIGGNTDYSNGANGYQIQRNNSGILYYNYNGTDYSSNKTIAPNVFYKLELNAQAGSQNLFLNDTLVASSSDANTVSNTYGVSIFSCHTNGNPNWYSSSKLKYLVMESNGEKLRDFIPAKRNSDSVIGLYDLITNSFFENAGTGAFIAGSEVPYYVDGYIDGKTIIGKWTQKPNPAIHGLPDGYTELECIIGGSTQYINTGFTPNQDTRVVLDHKFIGNTTFSSGFGSRVGASSRGFQYGADFNGDKTKSFVQYGNTYADAGNLYGAERHVVDFNKNNFYHDDVLKKTFSYTSFTAPGPLPLFALNDNGTIKPISDMVLYTCQIYDNGQIVRDFIPAKRNSDSVVGLYDIANGIFYENAGTGTFTAGAEVPQTIGGFLISKIKDYGTWTVTATDGTKTATQDILVDVITEYEIEMDYKLWLYRDGDECEDVTGGWTSEGYNCAGDSVIAATKNSDSFYATTNNTLAKLLGTVNAISFNGYSKLFVERKQTDANNLSQPHFNINTIKQIGNGRITGTDAAVSANVVEIAEIDISELNDSYYCIFTHTNAQKSGSGYLYKVWLER